MIHLHAILVVRLHDPGRWLEYMQDVGELFKDIEVQNSGMGILKMWQLLRG